ncbi:MAG: hypothetical protein EZS28_010962 [Streblomastix strix]|uniref:Uncharacterized protein n=1 Tax=Streblomastix strix TaxID=222440 RepID=A0A5J4WEZ3_9EUKA|nr:MAG: hypothetical protein EZS28_010962 [Streblomastix strix]
MEHGRLQMKKTMAPLVAFSGARMTKLAAIQRKDITDSGEESTVNIIINKRKKPRTRKIILRTRDGPCCLMRVTREWLQDEECKQGIEEKVLCRLHGETCNDDEAEADRGRSFTGGGE